MNILVKKDNQTFGPHSREEILEFIENGELTENDLGSSDGDENWDTLGKLLSSNEAEIDPSVLDQFEDDEVDYEKLKEWEDVFIDEDEEETEEESSLEGSLSTPTVSSPPPPTIKSSQGPPSKPETLTPPSDQESVVGEETLYSESQEPVLDSASEQPTESVQPPPPSLPLPPPPQVPPPHEQTVMEKSNQRSGMNRISSSHKIKGLNNKQTVIVVKGEGILSKLYSTSLLFIILFIIVFILGFAGLIFAPERVSPILKNIGVPADFIESITSPIESTD